MEYITNTDDWVVERSNSKCLKTLHECVKKVKLSEKVGVKLMQTWEDHAMIRDEGRMEGHKEMLVDSIHKIMKKMEIEIAEAMDLLEVPKKEREELYSLLVK